MNEPDLPAPLAMTRLRRLLVADLLAQRAFGLLARTISFPSMQDWRARFGTSPVRVQLTSECSSL